MRKTVISGQWSVVSNNRRPGIPARPPFTDKQPRLGARFAASRAGVKQQLRDAITEAISRRGAETRRNGTTRQTSLRLRVSAGNLPHDRRRTRRTRSPPIAASRAGVKQGFRDAITEAISRRGAETRRNSTTRRASQRLRVSAGNLLHT